MIETYWPDAASQDEFARRAEETGRSNPAFWNALPTLPTRPVDGHKGTFGTALCVGGSRGMSGAISLTGSAALVAGAGLTRLFVPEPILETVAGFAREYTTIPGACDASGRLTSAASEAILAEAANATALAVGPGFGRSAEATRLVVELFFELERPAVFDADALNALAEAGVFDESTEKSEKSDAISERFAGRKPRGARVLTPHPGEFARLTGAKPSGDRADRIDAATAFAERLERLFDGASEGKN
ncbi:MAG: NAD(P)H-hydrate dehydratase [Thermoguttaceae bacterium]|nr:NAD(P)H-hydrate dehydratase [Thermoguttaceae bacterium]